MKKYKLIILFICIIFFTYIVYLYHNNRIIILWEKYNNPINNVSYIFENDYYGIWIDSLTGKEKKIPCSIDDSPLGSFSNKEDLLYIFLYKFFYHINVDHIGIFQYNFNHIVLYEKTAIINGALITNKNFSPQEEYYFLKSIYLTIKIFFPEVETLYFYDENKLLLLNYTLPFFNMDMLEKKLLKFSDCKKYSLYIVPFIEDMGNKIFSIYEKNLFQIKTNHNIFQPKLKNKSDYPSEINKYKINDPNKVIFYINCISGAEDRIYLYYYPFLNQDQYICDKILFPSIVKNNLLYQEIISKIKEKIPDIEVCIAPFKMFTETVYPSFYIVCKASSELKAKEYIIMLENIL